MSAYCAIELCRVRQQERDYEFESVFLVFKTFYITNQSIKCSHEEYWLGESYTKTLNVFTVSGTSTSSNYNLVYSGSLDTFASLPSWLTFDTTTLLLTISPELSDTHQEYTFV